MARTVSRKVRYKIMKIQFNVKTGKDFRTIMAKYYDAKHALNDYICQKNDRCRALQQIFDTDYEQIKRIESGDTKGIVRDLETIKAEFVQMGTLLKSEQIALKSAKESCDNACEKAMNTVTEVLYNAAKSGDETQFNSEFANYLKKAGFDSATPENVPVLHFGVKANGAKAACKSGQLNGFMSKKQWSVVFLNTLADTLLEQKAIDPYKYAYKIPDKKTK